MKTTFLAAAFAVAMAVPALASGDYKLEAVSGVPSEVAAPLAELINPAGHKVLGPDGKVFCELWFVKAAPVAPKTSETDVTWSTAPLGALVGAIRFPAAGSERRGQALKPGVYTLRFALQPVNGDHQGVAPQRDFFVITPASLDTDAKPVSNLDALMNMTRKASGTPHPAVLSLWKVDSDFKAGLSKMGEDWVLQTSIGDVKVAIIVVGKTDA